MRRLLPCLVALSAAAPANATTALRIDLDDLVRQSDAVVIGVAETRDSYWEGSRIVTRVTVRVDDVWSGTTRGAQRIDVITLGGVVGSIGQRVSGSVSLPVGRRVVLCLVHDGAGAHRVVGMAQGVTFVIDDGSADPRVQRAPMRMRLVGPMLVEPFPATLSELERTVREIAGER
ncbi:MAG: hypothetical protein V3T05_10530 [Myxococcota bacterium]